MDEREQNRCQELYLKYRYLLFMYVKHQNPSLQEDDIHDILQEVWTALTDAIETVSAKNEKGQIAWLMCVSKNKTMDYFRAKKKKEQLGEKIGFALRDSLVGCSVQDAVIDKMIAIEVVENLTDTERKIFAAECFREEDVQIADTNAYKCKRYRLRKKIEEGLGIFDRKR